METGESLKSYKGVAEINAPAEMVFAKIEDINNTDWWDKNLTGIRVMLYEKNKRAQYYLYMTCHGLLPIVTSVWMLQLPLTR